MHLAVRASQTTVTARLTGVIPLNVSFSAVI